MRQAIALFAGLFISCAAAQVPESIASSCALLESVNSSIEYIEIDGIGTISDDDIPGYSLLSHDHQGIAFGYATSERGLRDLLIIGDQRMPIFGAKRLGRDRPQRIDSTQAIYAILRNKKMSYFCVASTFDGLGRSGSFQNVRQVYVAPLQLVHGLLKMTGVYYAVRDIRNIRRDK